MFGLISIFSLFVGPFAFAQNPIDDFLKATHGQREVEIPESILEDLEAMPHEAFQKHEKHNQVIHILRDRAKGETPARRDGPQGGEDPKVRDRMRLRCYSTLARLGEDQRDIVTGVLELAATTSAPNSLDPIAVSMSDVSWQRREDRRHRSMSHADVMELVLAKVRRLDALDRDRPCELLVQLSNEPLRKEFLRLLRQSAASREEVRYILASELPGIERENEPFAKAIREGAVRLEISLPTRREREPAAPAEPVAPVAPAAPVATPEIIAVQPAEPVPAEPVPALPSELAPPKPPALTDYDPLTVAVGLLGIDLPSGTLRDTAERLVRNFLARRGVDEIQRTHGRSGTRLIKAAYKGSRASLVTACNRLLGNSG